MGRWTHHPLVRAVSKDKLVDAPWLNRVGLQLARTVTARAIHRTRFPRRATGPLARLRHDGIVVLDDFLSRSQLAALRDEVLPLFDEAELPGRSQRQAGANVLDQLNVDKNASRTQRAQRFFSDRRLVDLMEGAERRSLCGVGSRLLSRLSQGDGAEHDPETTLHLDTFFHTHKAFFYLEDVTPARGPFGYVRESHRLGWRRLRHDWRNSFGTQEGSRRITEAEATVLVEDSFPVPANTLVIADTSGFHRRLPGTPGAVRYDLLWSVRINPFRP